MTVNKLSPLEAEVLSGIHENELISLMQELIRARSDFPPGDTRDAVKILRQVLDNENIDVEVISKAEHQPNLLATYPKRGNGKKLTYHAHIDTVQIGDKENWDFEPFAGVIQNNHIFGRGTGDDKSSVLIQIMALIILARANITFDGQLQVVIVSDEESGSLNGTKWLHDSGLLKTDALVVGEQTNNKIAIAERVACGIDLTVYGKSAHGAMPWMGENAVLIMADVLHWLDTKYIKELEKHKHPYLPPPTLNIGKITGGVQWNIVPEQCKVEMDRRLLPGETREEAMQVIHDVLDEFSNTVYPIEYKLFSTGEVATNINTPPDDPFVKQANQTLNDITEHENRLTGYPQTSDGRWFARDGIPILIFGPSDPAVGHSANEHVSIDQLVEGTKFLTVLALRWLKNNN